MENLYTAFFILLIAAVFIVPFTLEFNRWQKKGGKKWMGKFFLTLGLCLGVPVLVTAVYVLAGLVWNIAISEFYCLFMFLILFAITYLLARKYIQ